MQNAPPRVGAIEREAARFGVSDTEFIRWPWWRHKTLRHTLFECTPCFFGVWWYARCRTSVRY